MTQTIFLYALALPGFGLAPPLPAQASPGCGLPPSHLAVDLPDTWSQPVGGGFFAHAAVTDSAGCLDPTPAVLWESEDTTVVVTSISGVNRVPMWCLRPGVANLVARSGPLVAWGRVVCGPWPRIARLSLAPNRSSLRVGDTVRVVATPDDADGAKLPPGLLRWAWDPTDAFRLVRRPNLGIVDLVAERPAAVTVVATGREARGVVSLRVGDAPRPPDVARLIVTVDDTAPRTPRPLTLCATPLDAGGEPVARLLSWRLQDALALWRADEGVGDAGVLRVEVRRPGRWWVEAEAGGRRTRRWLDASQLEALPPPTDWWPTATYGGLALPGPDGSIRWLVCGNVLWWTLRGAAVEQILTIRATRDPLLQLGDSLFVEARGRLAPPGIVGANNPANSRTFEIDSLVSVEAWHASDCPFARVR